MKHYSTSKTKKSDKNARDFSYGIKPTNKTQIHQKELNTFKLDNLKNSGSKPVRNYMALDMELENIKKEIKDYKNMGIDKKRKGSITNLSIDPNIKTDYTKSPIYLSKWKSSPKTATNYGSSIFDVNKNSLKVTSTIPSSCSNSKSISDFKDNLTYASIKPQKGYKRLLQQDINQKDSDINTYRNKLVYDSRNRSSSAKNQMPSRDKIYDQITDGLLNKKFKTKNDDIKNSYKKTSYVQSYLENNHQTTNKNKYSNSQYNTKDFNVNHNNSSAAEHNFKRSMSSIHKYKDETNSLASNLDQKLKAKSKIFNDVKSILKSTEKSKSNYNSNHNTDPQETSRYKPPPENLSYLKYIANKPEKSQYSCDSIFFTDNINHIDVKQLRPNDFNQTVNVNNQNHIINIFNHLKKPCASVNTNSNFSEFTKTNYSEDNNMNENSEGKNNGMYHTSNNFKQNTDEEYETNGINKNKFFMNNTEGFIQKLQDKNNANFSEKFVRDDNIKIDKPQQFQMSKKDKYEVAYPDTKNTAASNNNTKKNEDYQKQIKKRYGTCPKESLINYHTESKSTKSENPLKNNQSPMKDQFIQIEYNENFSKSTKKSFDNKKVYTVEDLESHYQSDIKDPSIKFFGKNNNYSVSKSDKLNLYSKNQKFNEKSDNNFDYEMTKTAPIPQSKQQIENLQKNKLADEKTQRFSSSKTNVDFYKTSIDFYNDKVSKQSNDLKSNSRPNSSYSLKYDPPTKKDINLVNDRFSGILHEMEHLSNTVKKLNKSTTNNNKNDPGLPERRYSSNISESPMYSSKLDSSTEDNKKKLFYSNEMDQDNNSIEKIDSCIQANSDKDIHLKSIHSDFVNIKKKDGIIYNEGSKTLRTQQQSPTPAKSNKKVLSANQKNIEFPNTSLKESYDSKQNSVDLNTMSKSQLVNLRNQISDKISTYTKTSSSFEPRTNQQSIEISKEFQQSPQRSSIPKKISPNKLSELFKPLTLATPEEDKIEPKEIYLWNKKDKQFSHGANVETTNDHVDYNLTLSETEVKSVLVDTTKDEEQKIDSYIKDNYKQLLEKSEKCNENNNLSITNDSMEIRVFTDQYFAKQSEDGFSLTPRMPPRQEIPQDSDKDQDGEILKIREVIRKKQEKIKDTQDQIDTNKSKFNNENQKKFEMPKNILLLDENNLHNFEEVQVQQNIDIFDKANNNRLFPPKMDIIEEERTYLINDSALTCNEVNLSQDVYYKNQLKNISGVSYGDLGRDSLLAESDASILEIKNNIENFNMNLKGTMYSMDLDESDIIKYLDKKTDFTAEEFGLNNDTEK